MDRSRRPPTGLVATLAALLVLVAACGGGIASPTSTDAPAPTPTATDASSSPSTSPSPSTATTLLEPSVSFSFETAPVVTRELAGVDERYINPGAIIDDGGTLHMFANLFTAWPGRVEIVHLRSADGLTWEPAQPDPIFSSDDVDLTSSGADVSTGFIAADGTWVLIFETVEVSRPWRLGRATAPAPDGPWTIDSEPILEPGAAGARDAGGLSWPSVVATDDGWAMYYTALDRPRGTGVIAMATSSDGVAWTKRDSPVLVAESAWEQRKLDRPRVAPTANGLAMVYAGGRLTDRGLAWSEEGVAWRRDGETPVITQADFPVNGQAWDAALLERDGELLYYLEIGSASGSAASTEVYLARASVP